MSIEFFRILQNSLIVLYLSARNSKNENQQILGTASHIGWYLQSIT